MKWQLHANWLQHSATNKTHTTNQGTLPTTNQLNHHNQSLQQDQQIQLRHKNLRRNTAGEIQRNSNDSKIGEKYSSNQKMRRKKREDKNLKLQQAQ